jgi:hypothetical protein
MVDAPAGSPGPGCPAAQPPGACRDPLAVRSPLARDSHGPNLRAGAGVGRCRCGRPVGGSSRKDLRDALVDAHLSIVRDMTRGAGGLGTTLPESHHGSSLGCPSPRVAKGRTPVVRDACSLPGCRRVDVPSSRPTGASVHRRCRSRSHPPAARLLRSRGPTQVVGSRWRGRAPCNSGRRREDRKHDPLARDRLVTPQQPAESRQVQNDRSLKSSPQRARFSQRVAGLPCELGRRRHCPRSDRSRSASSAAARSYRRAATSPASAISARSRRTSGLVAASARSRVAAARFRDACAGARARVSYVTVRSRRGGAEARSRWPTHA